MTSYCEVAIGHPIHGPYHDEEYGFPIADDDALFERLVLEINQALIAFDPLSRMMAADRVCGRKNPWSQLFDPARTVAGPGTGCP